MLNFLGVYICVRIGFMVIGIVCVRFVLVIRVSIFLLNFEVGFKDLII